jgi:hypothetical protein
MFMFKHILEIMTRSEFKTLSLHIPYEKRYLALPLLVRQKTIPCDEAHEGFIPTEFIMQAQNVLTHHLLGPARDLLINYTLNLVAVITSIYNLFTCVTTSSTVTGICIALANTASTVALLAKAYGMDVSLDSITSLVTSIATSCYSDEAHEASGGLPRPSNVTTVIKALSLLLAGITTCTMHDVGPVIGKLNGAVTLSNNFTTVLQDLALDVFGLDVTGIGALRDAAQELENKGKELATLTAQALITNSFNEAKNWMDTTEKFLRTVRPTNFNTATLIAMHAQITKRVIEAQQELSECRSRPAPAALYLYGARGHGKTELLKNCIIAKLNKAFSLQGNEAKLYDLNSGKYHRRLLGERWAVFDEFGAAVQPNNNSVDPTTLNSIISGGVATIPGASVDTKQQTAAFNAVFLMANKPLKEIDVGFTPEAKMAFASRFREVYVEDPQYDNKRTRSDQPHRALDFSHLNLMMKSEVSPLPNLKKRRGDYLVSVDQLVKVLISDIKRNQENHVALTSNIGNLDSDAAGFPLWSPDEPHASTDPPVFWIAGKPGVGKTKHIVPLIETTATALGMEVVYGMTRNSANRTFFILDDVVNLLTLEGQTTYKSFFDALQWNDVVFVISNFGRHKRFPTYGKFSEIQDIPPFLNSIFRRCAQNTARHYEVLDTGLYHWTEGKVEIDTLISHVAGAVVNMDVGIKNEMPPSDVQYDVDMCADMQPSIDNIWPVIQQGAHNPIAFATLAPKVRQILSSTMAKTMSPNDLIRTIVDSVIRDCPNIKIRLITPTTAYGLVNGILYMSSGFDNPVQDITDDNFTVNDRGTLLTITRQEFLDFRANNASLDNRHGIALVKLKATSPYAWDTLCRRYPKTWNNVVTDALAAISLRTKQLINWIMHNPIVACLIVLIVFGLKKWYSSNTELRHSCVCKYFNDEDCPFDESHTKKGKTKGKRSRYTHYKSININGRLLYEDDMDNQFEERIWHEMRHRSREGGTRHTWAVGGISFLAEFDDVAGRWSVTSQDEAHARLRDTRLYNQLKSNVRDIMAADGTTMKCTFVSPEMAFLPRHFKDHPTPWFVDGIVKVEPKYTDEDREIFC